MPSNIRGVKPACRKVLFGTGLLFLLFAFFVAAEHVRGRIALAHYQKQLRAKQERLTVSELVPLYPARENAFEEFVLAAKQLRQGAVVSMSSPTTMQLVAPGRARVICGQNVFWIRGLTNSWLRLAKDLERNQEPLDQVRATLKQPGWHARLDYARGFEMDLSHLSRYREAAQWLNAATLFELHNGDLPQALDNLLALAALARLQEDERRFDCHRVRLFIATIGLNLTWEMLQAPGWTDAQLAQLQQAWQAGDFIRDVERCLEMERALGHTYFARLRKSGPEIAGWARLSRDQILSATPRKRAWNIPLGEEMSEIFAEGVFDLYDGFLYPPLWRLAWSHQDEGRYLQNMQVMLEAVRRTEKSKSLTTLRVLLADLESKIRNAGPYDHCRFLYSPSPSYLIEELSRPLRCETQRAMTVTAIALKRYQLRCGKAAPSLAALVPELLPQLPTDYMDGQPLRYRSNADGTFALYSVGEDGQDDGGDPALPELRNRPRLWDGRDAVWPLPASPEQIAAYDARPPRR